jgi:hypothetical protein
MFFISLYNSGNIHGLLSVLYFETAQNCMVIVHLCGCNKIPHIAVYNSGNLIITFLEHRNSEMKVLSTNGVSEDLGACIPFGRIQTEHVDGVR